MSLKVVYDDDVVGINCPDGDDLSDSFIEIYVCGGLVDSSPFNDIESARMFAEILVKLLEAVHDFEW